MHRRRVCIMRSCVGQLCSQLPSDGSVLRWRTARRRDRSLHTQQCRALRPGAALLGHAAAWACTLAHLSHAALCFSLLLPRFCHFASASSSVPSPSLCATLPIPALFRRIHLCACHFATHLRTVAAAVVERVHAPPAMTFLQERHSQMPTALRLTLSLPQKAHV
jgi:hypothetical protein